MAEQLAYEILVDDNPKKLSGWVNDRIQRGWEPFGGPFGVNGQVCQAMILPPEAGKRVRKESLD